MIPAVTAPTYACASCGRRYLDLFSFRYKRRRQCVCGSQCRLVTSVDELARSLTADEDAMDPKPTDGMDRVTGPENVHDFVPRLDQIPDDYPHRRHFQRLQARVAAG